tara:strand:- start:1601 stop:2680 length:1080 start_codon:yes stop_codon:yes gene_type:complete
MNTAKRKKKKPALLPRFTSPRRFRYKPLNPVRPLVPLGYILVDELIDMAGFHLFRNIYPKSTEDFSVIGNYEDAPFEMGVEQRGESVWPELKQSGGPGVSYLTLHHKLGRTNKSEITIDPNVLKYRTKVWKQIVRWIESGALTAYELSADGRCKVIPKIERGLIRFQSEHILRTSSAWRVDGIGYGHRILICFRKGNVRSLIQKETATKGTKAAQAIELSVEQTISLLKELGLYCQEFAQPISEQSAIDIIEATFRGDVRFPAKKKMREVFIKVKRYLGPDAFCQRGEKFEFSKMNSTKQRQYVNRYIQYRDLVASGIIARENLFKYVKKPTGSDVVERFVDLVSVLIERAGQYDEETE